MSEQTIDLDAERYLRKPTLQALLACMDKQQRSTVEQLIRYAYQAGRLDGNIATLRMATDRVDAMIEAGNEPE